MGILGTSKTNHGGILMQPFAYYFHEYWLSVVVILGVIGAAMLVHRNWDKIVIKGSGRK
jgi:hypothetical protein